MDYFQFNSVKKRRKQIQVYCNFLKLMISEAFIYIFYEKKSELTLQSAEWLNFLRYQEINSSKI